MGHLKSILILTAIASSTACARSSNNSLIELEFECPRERSDVCIELYDPVCAVKLDGNTKTYSSGCHACLNEDVVGFNPSPCKTEPKAESN